MNFSQTGSFNACNADGTVVSEEEEKEEEEEEAEEEEVDVLVDRLDITTTRN